jgi:hypothetical protein
LVYMVMFAVSSVMYFSVVQYPISGLGLLIVEAFRLQAIRNTRTHGRTYLNE